MLITTTVQVMDRAAARDWARQNLVRDDQAGLLKDILDDPHELIRQ